VLQTGGGQHRPPRRAPRSLSMAEREELSRAPSTGSRELARNGGRHRYRARPPRPPPSTAPSGRSLPSWCCSHDCGRWWRQAGVAVVAQQLAGWLRVADPQDAVLRVSHETIYLSLFVQRRGALRRERWCMVYEAPGSEGLPRAGAPDGPAE
jgi:hypothetical protein